MEYQGRGGGVLAGRARVVCLSGLEGTANDLAKRTSATMFLYGHKGFESITSINRSLSNANIELGEHSLR